MRLIGESIFYKRNSLDTTKCHTLLGSIETDILNAVRHIVVNPPDQNLYETRKNPLLSEFQNSQGKRLQKNC